MQISDHHSSFTTSQEIAEICRPLFEAYGITYFGYIRVYRDGSRADLTTYPAKLKHVLTTDYADSMEYADTLITPKQNIVLWNDGTKFLPDNSKWLIEKKLADSRTFFNIDHGIAIVEGYKDYFDTFEFASSNANSKIIEFYFSNFDILRLFILYFKDKAEKLILNAHKNKIMMPKISKSVESLELSNNTLLRKQEFIAKIRPTRYALSSDKCSIFLTEKQACCLSLLAIGKTAKQAAILLNISPKTVEYHIEMIKGKLQCETLDELLNIFWDSPLNILRKEILDLSQRNIDV